LHIQVNILATFLEMATSPNQATTPPPSLVNLPEGLTPDSIDTLPVLSALLSRLQTPSSTAHAASTSGSPPAASPSQLVSGTGPLSIKDIPPATDELKHKLQKARVQVKELPDMDRSVEEQEVEIRELEEKIKKQREVLVGLREVGLQAKREKEPITKDGSASVMET
jgi:small-conductance mechanosensitive channel